MGTDTISYLKMDGSTENLFECKMMRLSSGDLTYLNTAKMTFNLFEGVTSLTFPNITAAQAKCFQGEPTPATVQATIGSMNGIPNTGVGFNLTSWQVYHLSK